MSWNTARDRLDLGLGWRFSTLVAQLRLGLLTLRWIGPDTADCVDFGALRSHLAAFA